MVGPFPFEVPQLDIPSHSLLPGSLPYSISPDLAAIDVPVAMLHNLLPEVPPCVEYAVGPHVALFHCGGEAAAPCKLVSGGGRKKALRKDVSSGEARRRPLRSQSTSKQGKGWGALFLTSTFFLLSLHLIRHFFDLLIRHFFGLLIRHFFDLLIDLLFVIRPAGSLRDGREGG